jgi:hypothetical protein
MPIADLNDSRRAGKTWLPSDDRDVTNGLVRLEPLILNGARRPECVVHGSMNRVSNIEDSDGSLPYRCSQCGVGARWWHPNHKEVKIAFRKAWDARVTA